jgi:small subunit ribosomal protein S8
MAVNDVIADLLTRIRNAKDAKHRYVDLRSSYQLIGVVKVLKEQGFIANYLVDEQKNKMRIFLKYGGDRQSAIRQLKRISKPGLRRYVKVSKIPRILSGFGIAILSTPKGIIDGETARKENVGGELLCTIW